MISTSQGKTEVSLRSGAPEGGWPTLRPYIRNCGCPVLALFARAGTMLPIARDFDLSPLDLKIAVYDRNLGYRHRNARWGDNHSHGTNLAVPYSLLI